MISYCLASYNSLEYLKLLVMGLRRVSRVDYEIIVNTNGSTDGTLEWVRDNIDRFRQSDINEGFCGVNHAINKARGDHVCVVNADMWPLPAFDTLLVNEARRIERFDNRYMLSCCLVEPLGNNPEYTIANFGDTHKNFNPIGLEGDFCYNQLKYYKTDRIQYSHPIFMNRQFIEEIGLFDTDYFPGWSADHDIAARAYSHGCRIFKMLGSARMYHFISQTFRKLPNDIRSRDGQDVFRKKWGISVDDFRRRMGIAQPYKEVPEGCLIAQ